MTGYDLKQLLHFALSAFYEQSMSWWKHTGDITFFIIKADRSKLKHVCGNYLMDLIKCFLIVHLVLLGVDLYWMVGILNLKCTNIVCTMFIFSLAKVM